MGSSGEGANKGIDTTAGALVWVRRRNGAWWPGQILGRDELPAGCASTARTGTPVRLLGREGASVVDWYNLEKSKRVKSFHCKEYNECIKKVQASSSKSKKAGKYARRDDAILHALELENAHLGKDHAGLSATPDAEDHHPIDDSPSCEESEDMSDGSNASRVDFGSGPEVSQSGISFDGQPDLVGAANGPENESEDDGSKRVKRMRGLKDLGMDVALPRKRKRTQVGPVHEFLKRKSRSRPLTKVMECATKVSISTVSNESKKNTSALINNNSDSNGVSSENGTLSTASRHFSDARMKSKLNVLENGPSQKLFDMPLLADGKKSPAHPGTFGWRLKRKRNSRKRKVYLNEKAEPHTAGVNCASFFPCWNRNVRPRNLGGPLIYDNGGYCTKSRPSTSDPLVPPRLLPYRLSRLTVNPKYDDSEHSLTRRKAALGLHDVYLEVKSEYRPQHVPYISLMSKLTARPVVGHPLTIEVLEDGSTDYIVSKYESNPSEDEFALESVLKRRGRPLTKRGPPSRRNRPLSKKTRKLSSLTGPRRLDREETRLVVEKLKGPSIACVPVKIVFSRINAALTSSVRAVPRH